MENSDELKYIEQLVLDNWRYINKEYLKKICGLTISKNSKIYLSRLKQNVKTKNKPLTNITRFSELKFDGNGGIVDLFVAGRMLNTGKHSTFIKKVEDTLNETISDKNKALKNLSVSEKN